MSESTKASTLRLDESKIAFIDTMIFLHFRSFDQIDWPTILDANQVTIIIPPITIRELNKHKDSNALQKIRERAQTVIGKLLDGFKDSNEANVRRGVDIKYETAEPRIDFDAYKLDSKWADDYLLATVISFKAAHPEANIVIVTDDLNLILKSRQYRIDALRLPKELKLPNVLDAYEKQIKELEKIVQELKNQSPVLRLGFENDSNRVVFSLVKPPEFTNERIEQTVEQLKQEFPKIEVPPLAPVDPNKPRRGAIASEYAKDLETDAEGYTVYDKREYNTELDKFFSEYEDYLNKMVLFLDIKSRTVELDILVYNDGTAPAEDIDIHLHLPEGFDLTTKDVKQPSKPNPPKLRTNLEKMEEMVKASFISPAVLYPHLSGSGRPSEPPNVSRPSIRRAKSYDVDYRIRKLKHNMLIRLDRLYVVFDSFESAKSFGIGYWINAGNVPREVNDTLHVIIEKEV